MENLQNFLDRHPAGAKKIPGRNVQCLNLWQELLDALPKDILMPGFPIWGMEFGATYPYEDTYPLALPYNTLREFKGNFGVSLDTNDESVLIQRLPSYARVKSPFPAWKKTYIRQSRKFYEDHKETIREVVEKIAKYDSQSWQKLEWNTDKTARNIRDHIIQFRSSGIRVKKADFFPSLVCTITQVPIIGWENRYITKEEGLRLQALDGIELPEQDNAAFHALGNAVNAKIVLLIAERLFGYEDKSKVLKPSRLSTLWPLRNGMTV